MLEQMRLEEQERQVPGRDVRSRASQPIGQGSEEGYWAYMQRQVQERTERLGIMSDNMDKFEQNSSGFADDVNKFIRNQKRKAVLGGKLCDTDLFLLLIPKSAYKRLALGSKFGL